MLDTDTVSFLVRGVPQKLREAFLRQDPDNLAISAVVCAEIAYGLRKKGSRALTERVNAFLDQLRVIDFDKDCAEKYAGIRCALESEGLSIGNTDMMIGASALSAGAVLVTNNAAHFSRIAGLWVENWC